MPGPRRLRLDVQAAHAVGTGSSQRRPVREPNDETHTTATVKFVRASLKSALRASDQAIVDYRLAWDTTLFGSLTVDHTLTLTLDRPRNQWGVEWNDGLIWPALEGGNLLAIDYSIPRRANIYDADGKGLAVESKIVTVGLVPGRRRCVTTDGGAQPDRRAQS